ncbi:Alpha and gamma adaptin binding protein p34 domain containing protein [Naviculisporaceae sp. PSN 640]
MAEISNPRRILAVSLAGSAEHLSQVIKDLTGSFPEPVVIPSPPPPQSTSSASDLKSPAEPLPPPPATTTLAGTTHLLPLKTAYYSASVPIWLDLISSPEEWSSSFLSDEAKEVLEVLGGVLVIFPLGSSSSQSSSSTSAAEAKELVAHVGRVVREGLGGTDWEGVGLAVGVSSATLTQSLSSSSSGKLGEDLDAVLDEWEDYCWDSGLEFVHHRVVVSSGGTGKKETEEPANDSNNRNEFGEKMGIARVLEALQANEWSFAGGDDDFDEGEEAEDEDFGSFQKGKGAQRKAGVEGEDDDDDAELDPENLNFGFDREDFVGLRKAIWKGGGDGRDDGDEEEDNGDGDEDEVKKLERMMHKLQAVRDMTAGMPEEQRKRMAKRAVDEVMKEL